MTIHYLILTLENICGYNDNKPDFDVDFKQNIQSLPNDNKIVGGGGDFNLVLDVLKDKKGGQTTTYLQSQNGILSWMEETDL